MSGTFSCNNFGEALNQFERVSIKLLSGFLYLSSPDFSFNTALALYGQAARAISIG